MNMFISVVLLSLKIIKNKTKKNFTVYGIVDKFGGLARI